MSDFHSADELSCARAISVNYCQSSRITTPPNYCKTLHIEQIVGKWLVFVPQTRLLSILQVNCIHLRENMRVKRLHADNVTEGENFGNFLKQIGGGTDLHQGNCGGMFVKVHCSQKRTYSTSNKILIHMLNLAICSYHQTSAFGQNKNFSTTSFPLSMIRTRTSMRPTSMIELSSLHAMMP